MMFKVKCPYCGFEQMFDMGKEYESSSDIEICPNCDLRFVLDVDAEIKIKTLKIEGEED